MYFKVVHTGIITDKLIFNFFLTKLLILKQDKTNLEIPQKKKRLRKFCLNNKTSFNCCEPSHRLVSNLMRALLLEEKHFLYLNPFNTVL